LLWISFCCGGHRDGAAAGCWCGSIASFNRGMLLVTYVSHPMDITRGMRDVSLKQNITSLNLLSDVTDTKLCLQSVILKEESDEAFPVSTLCTLVTLSNLSFTLSNVSVLLSGLETSLSISSLVVF